MNTQKRLHKIAKRILSDLNFSTREQLDDYLKKHPNTRLDTKFFVDGIEVKVDGQSKKTEKNNSIVDNILKKHPFLKGKDGMVNIYKKILEKEGSLDNIPERVKELAFNFVNSRLGEGNELDKKTFDLLFESGLKKFQDSLKKEEEEKPKDKELELMSKRSAVLRNHRVSNFRQISRRQHFEELNRDLRKNGLDELTESNYKGFLKVMVFNFVPGMSREEQKSYTEQHFCKGANWGSMSSEDVDTINETLTDLAIDFPKMDEVFDEIKKDNRIGKYVIAEVVHYGLGLFNDGYGTALKFNTNSEVFQKDFVPFKYNKKKQELAKARGRDYRYNVHEAETRKDAVQRTVTHEIGHKLYWQKVVEDAGYTKKDGISAFRRSSKFQDEWRQLWMEIKRSQEISKISEYATKNHHEFFAECFAMYRYEKENLPPKVLKKMEEFIKWCSMMK